MKIKVVRTGETLAGSAGVAATFTTRLKGLLTRSSLPLGEALIIRPCRQIHMCFMHFPIDVLFCSSKNQVVAIEENLKPWRISKYSPSAAFAVELPAGLVRTVGVEVGDFLEFA